MSNSTANILVIDDQLDNLRALSKILQGKGYRVRQAPSGSMALRAIAAQPPDLILLDILMPEMDGYTVCTALKLAPQTREIPIIFLSALDEVSDKIKAFDMGGVDYITKPFQIGEVVARINNQLILQQKQRQWSDLLDQLKNDFLSTISHELRTPVANMRMVLQLLMLATEQGQTFLDQVAGTEPENNRIMQYFKILQEECEREISLIQDLLDLQHLEAGAHPPKLVPLDLNEWVLHLLESYELQFQTHHQRLTVKLSPNLPALTTDVNSLSRIVTELLNNALKYTPVNQEIMVSSEANASHILLHIRNSGVEIPPEERSRIFDKFYRIPNHDPWRHNGTGLGLSLVWQLVKQMGGTIQVTSGDRMTCFTLQLPWS
ncbi:MAG: hybrid sensor histidine kinase/response regulator [Oculatellaceae cyanobacterium bins.114]|nr:hybrid sensor histidine kinase/response regulator [Oculatellaceae cyanobacterium bins.114]